VSPAQYVVKVPTYTAVQWDGSDESATWILQTAYAGSRRSGDELVLLDSMDREFVLPAGSWVVADTAGGEPRVLDEAAFAAAYEPAD
jgi:hypothetical protein